MSGPQNHALIHGYLVFYARERNSMIQDLASGADQIAAGNHGSFF